jgi:hypothetical protein
MHSESFPCRVCGYLYSFPPWGKDGKTPTFEICDCCGVEFGYEDATLAAIHQYRSKWLSNGAEWNRPECKPVNWDLEAQLAQISNEFL